MARRRSTSPKKTAKAEAQDEPVPDAGSAKAVEAASGPVVLIELDASLPAGLAQGRFDIMLRGRALSTDAIEEVRLEQGGRVIAAASYGLPERAAVAAMPDGSRARQRGFQFNLPHRAIGGPGKCRFELIARTEAGFERTETFLLDIDPAAVPQVRIADGPAREGIAAQGAPAHTAIYIDRATIDGEGGLVVQGWAVALSPVLALQVHADEQRVGKARLGQEREDVGLAYPAYPNARLSGFSLTTQLGPVERDAARLRVRVVCPNGFGHEESVLVEHLRQHARPAPALPGQAPPDQLRVASAQDEPPAGLAMPPEPVGTAAAEPAAASSEIHMFFDTADLSEDGHLFINGWAVCAAGIVQVRVFVDEQDIGLAAHGFERPDVAAAYPGISHAGFSGFKYDHKIRDSFKGEHAVRVTVRNIFGEERSETLLSVARPAARPVLPAEPEAPSEAPPELTEDQAQEFKFELDSPVLVNGAVPEVITGRLTIDGWLLSRSGVERFVVYLDGQRLGEMHYGLARQDVGQAFPDWPNSLRSGYAFHCQPRSLKNGKHTIRLEAKSNSGVTIDKHFQITVKKADDLDDQAGLRRRVPRVETDMMLALLDDLGFRPHFRFLMRQGATINAEALVRTLEALRLQAFDEWSMTLLAEDDAIVTPLMVLIKESFPDFASRFTTISPSRGGCWNAPLASVEEGRLVLNMLLSPGDELGADALWELAVALARHPEATLAYGDEIRVSPVSQEKEGFFKPDFSPDLLTATNYLGRPWAVTSSALAATGATPATLAANGEYDLVLRCAEQAGAIRHVPKLLCQRGVQVLDTPAQEKAALQAMMARRAIAGSVLETPIPGTWRLKRDVLVSSMVSIIIPTCAANGHIETCINSLRQKTRYKNYEIIVIDNIPAAETHWKAWVRDNADTVVDIPTAFNWSVFNNRAAAIAHGEFVLFLNDDITVTQPGWLDAMLEHAQRPEVGIVGPQLLYPDGKVQHAGMFLANPGIGRHAFRFAAHDDPCYFGLALTQRNMMAVTGACMLVRKALFDRLGGFEEAHEVVNNDLDFCLRVHKAGYLTVFTPYASLIHHELASRARMKDVFDLTHFNAAWKTTFAAGDPYFNPRLWRHADDYRPDDEPVQWVVSGSPVFHAEEIQRILVVKLDHIGDFVTALSPIRRLKQIFPHAKITVLASPASRAFVALEPSIDEFIPFAFFHARSQLGERELTKEDYEELGVRLRPHRFDLAVDLRKHPSTRDVLKYTGARFLAGFDYLGQHPNLDVALDWDGDRPLQRKRSHIVGDLLSLVNAIGQATECDRSVMKPEPLPLPLSDLPQETAALFAKPVVAIHPGAGNVTKQWPEEHFSALIDLLIERNDVNILLIGGPDEAEVAERLRDGVLHSGRAGSLAGKTPLAVLPRILKNCVLYIGNDSGPKHIAAALGIPTIGIHSGVVDPVEWAPIGPNAVALRRNMTCSPCYLAKAEDCPRSLACLKFFEPSMVYETADLMLARVRVLRVAPVIPEPQLTE